MQAETISSSDRVLDSVTKIVSVYLERNTIAPELVAGFIDGVFKAVLGQHKAAEPVAPGTVPEASVEPVVIVSETVVPAPEVLKPAVPISESVTPDYIVCLEDGKKLKVLKRHLATTFGLTPAQYRAKWGLPKDYPTTAPAYAARRSEVAKQFGLGNRRPAAPIPVIDPVPEPISIAEPAGVESVETAAEKPPRKTRQAKAAVPAVVEPAPVVTAPLKAQRGRPKSNGANAVKPDDSSAAAPEVTAPVAKTLGRPPKKVIKTAPPAAVKPARKTRSRQPPG